MLKKKLKTSPKAKRAVEVKRTKGGRVSHEESLDKFKETLESFYEFVNIFLLLYQ